MPNSDPIALATETEDVRSRIFVILAAILLVVVVTMGFWTESAVAANALAVALVVFGFYAFVMRSGLADRLMARRAGPISYYETSLTPVFITDLNGTVMARNPAARAHAVLHDPAGAMSEKVYRICREVRANGHAAEPGPEEQSRLIASRLDGRSILWRLDTRCPQPEPRSYYDSVDVAVIRIDADDRIVDANATARALGGEALERSADLLSDAPVRGGEVHLARAGGRALRAIVLAETEGLRDLALVPLQSDELSGLTPDEMLEELPVALMRLDAEGRVVYLNRAARGLLGKGDCGGARLSDLIEGLGRSIPERLRDTLKGRGLGRPEVAKSVIPGHEMFLQVTFTRSYRDGTPAVMAVLSDATELKTLEAQFVQSQKMQAVGQLAGGVAHDFNNLLTAINGHCDLLLMRHDVADQEHGDLMQIRQNANRAAALVRQLLAFSRKQTLRPKVINLQDTLSELTHLLNRLLSERIKLTIENAPDLALVRVDEQQFEQVIMNLVVNARDAMPQGGEVKVTTENVHLSEDMHRDRAVVFKGEYVVVTVADCGTGIPADKMNKIFEPFYTTKQVGEGTGLGLSTVYGIIKQTGGFIFADSPEEGGAVFSIYLPAYDKNEAEDAPAPEARPAAPRDLTGRGVVLLVEDEDPVRSFAARALQLRGYTVMEAASGEEALEILADKTLEVDLFLSDVIMPGLDGPAWVRTAREDRPGTKVIFMSGYTEDAFADDPGVSDAAFLPKPFTLPDLTQRVKATLDGPQS